MLNIIGIGLNEKSISKEAKEAIKKSKKLYLETYTVELPYPVKNLEKNINKKIIHLSREDVESDRLVNEAKKQNIALLVYGSPLFATTHIILIDDCKKSKVKVNIIYNASVFDALSETGLQLYKFGKISSIPKWEDHFKPDSFLDFVKQNQKINAHSLLLTDIGLDFRDALDQLKQASETKYLKLDKILVCSQLGTKESKIIYANLNKLKKQKIQAPYCFVIPTKMHFLEEEVVKSFSI